MQTTSIWIYALLGTIQGVFEWLPISSQGVVALVSQFLIKDFKPIDMALFLHLGTLFAVLLYFRKEWKEVLFLRDKELLRFLTISTIISLSIGYLLYNWVLNIVIGGELLLLTGIGLLFTAFFHKKKSALKISSDKLAMVAGVFQGLSVIPGLSRSAATIFALSLSKNRPSEVLRISYMMSAPVVLAATTYIFLKDPVIITDSWVALVFSFLVGLAMLKVLLRLSERLNFFKFALIFSLLCFIGAAVEGFLN